ncbi:hypothetical protein HS088_TW17G01071 [Tripterygium wilfordii]|uniref:Transmembrane protein n=1 Tax=Tripterygium wilfordii TaxID=458696 RepID=A0A7J7CHM9_TRIWF|nr:uncharacterized protein LOC119983033 [Tripterygium wilfordii]XP_038682611.1 uncharacterized protein LOC119983033 [Tripterygium wilfordii]KAF5733526.1 hypothetical protein HS088_TW17G01071 [Tripterygium wilfordii]
MAAAEARTIWQRTANRCFIQEDAKRAPKLACCQSSSSSSKQVDPGPTNAADAVDLPALGFMPLNRNSSFTNLPLDTRWWLQMQPSYGYQKGLTYEQLKAMESEMERLRDDILNSSSGVDKAKPYNDHNSAQFDCNKNSESYHNMHHEISADPEVKKAEVKTSYSKDTQYIFGTRYPSGNHESREMDPVGFTGQKKIDEYCSDLESPWVGVQRTEPWWRTTDKDELATLVAQKSLNCIENCDLPPPRKIQRRRYQCAAPVSVDCNGPFALSLDCDCENRGISTRIFHAQTRPGTEKAHGRERNSVEERHSDPPLSYNIKDSYGVNCKNTKGMEQTCESDLSKAQLLEALRHSQTRAREAEKVAKQACAEKEHTARLVFRQASQLFAYKQWFQLLQLENLYYQIKNKDQQISTLFPVAFPWMTYKGRKLRKCRHRSSKGKQYKEGVGRVDISKYAVVFALGLSLVGAGLLLGWTVGGMLPF